MFQFGNHLPTYWEKELDNKIIAIFCKYLKIDKSSESIFNFFRKPDNDLSLEGIVRPVGA